MAQRWKCNEDDIIYLALTQKIQLSVNLDSYTSSDLLGKNVSGILPPPPISGWWQLLIKAEIAGFLPNNDSAAISTFLDAKTGRYRRIKASGLNIDAQCLEADGTVTLRFMVKRKDLVVMRESVDLYEFQHRPAETETDKTVQKKETKVPKGKGGRPARPLREAVEHLFCKCMERGQKHFIVRNNNNNFMWLLKNLIIEKDEVHDSYIAERIETVKQVGASSLNDWKITENQRLVQSTEQYEKFTKPKEYKLSDVSSILSILRKKHQIS